MSSTSKIIRAGSVKKAESTAKIPAGEDVMHKPSSKPAGFMTTRQIEEIQQQAYEEGFALGKEEGFKAGQLELQEHVNFIQQILNALDQPFKQLDQQVEQQLVSLAITMVKQLVRRELRTDPGQIIAVVREAMMQLPVASRNIRLHLNPEDAALVREALAASEESASWTVVEDPVLSRGGCRVTTDTSQIDATMETRLSTLIANVLGGERASDTE